ncbi:MAG: hypothetical protein JKX67_08525 [Colwellia sp.]|nr:hypothetical protein [Colwellia sp.]
MKTNLCTALWLILLSPLIGCGGGDSQSTPAATAPETTQQTAAPAASATEIALRTSDLVSAPEFDLSANIKLQVTIPPSPSTTIRYFINICSDFSSKNNEIEINYASCKLRTTLSSQEQQFTISLSTTEIQLIAQIWPIEKDAIPLNIFFDLSELDNNWQLAF